MKIKKHWYNKTWCKWAGNIFFFLIPIVAGFGVIGLGIRIEEQWYNKWVLFIVGCGWAKSIFGLRFSWERCDCCGQKYWEHEKKDKKNAQD